MQALWEICSISIFNIYKIVSASRKAFRHRASGTLKLIQSYLPGTIYVTVANKAKVKGYRVILKKLDANGVELPIRSAIYYPNFALNLISVRKLREANVTFGAEFDKIFTETKEEVPILDDRSNLYYIKATPENYTTT